MKYKVGDYVYYKGIEYQVENIFVNPSGEFFLNLYGNNTKVYCVPYNKVMAKYKDCPELDGYMNSKVGDCVRVFGEDFGTVTEVVDTENVRTTKVKVNEDVWSKIEWKKDYNELSD